MTFESITEPIRRRTATGPIDRQTVVDWVVASIVTGFVFTLIGQAINVTWHTPGYLPKWLTAVQGIVLVGGFYYVTVGLVGVAVARRYGYGKVTGVGLATLGSTIPFLIWGWIRLPEQQRVDMWTALQFDGEFRLLVAFALVVALVAVAAGIALGVGVYSLVRRGENR